MAQEVHFKSASPNPELPGVVDVAPQEVQNLKGNLVLIDVRRPDEYSGELGHVEGAKLLTLDFLPQKLAEIPKDQTVVFICRSGGRSGRATAFAKQNGYEKVYNMKGGMILWNEMGLQVER